MRFSQLLFFIITLLCLKSTFTPLRAETLRSTVSLTDGGKKVVVINGKAQPLFWCDGITKISDLDAYARSGFNAVVVRLFWAPSKDGSLMPQDLQPQQTFAAAAAARGLYVIYALPEAPFGQVNQFTFSAANRAYFFMWESWVKSAMKSLAATPNLIGWMLPDDPRGLPTVDDADFRGWLMQHYSSLPVLNKEWMTGFGSFDDITLEYVESMVQLWRGVKPPGGAMSDADFRSYVQQATSRRNGSPNWAFHPAALALGLYRWDNFGALVNRWAQIVHQADPQHIVFSGQLPDYAQLLALPANVDVSVPAVWPGSAENDIVTGNPQAVDIARRAGRFCAMPMLPTALADDFPPDLVASRLQAWSDAALAHGASGLALSSWNDVAANDALQKIVQSTVKKIHAQMQENRWQQAPLATTAIVLTPLADGYTLVGPTETISQPLPQTMGTWQETPTVHTTHRERGLYGFCNQLVSGEPSDLVYAMRWGSQFGAVDYLSPEDLGGEYSLSKGGVLKKYAAVLLPQAYWTPPPVVTELAQYVNGGGVIVADLGIGAAQAGDQVVDMQPTLTALFGVVPQKMQIVAFNLTTAPDAGLLPSWATLAMTQQSVLTAGDGPGGAAFAGPTVFTTLLPGTKRLGLGFQLPTPLGVYKEKEKPKYLLQRVWLSGAPQGRGLAIYAPFRLWTNWHPGFHGFDEFHRDLLGRGAALTTILNLSLFPSPDPAPGAPQMFPQMINYPQGIALINHTPPTPNAGDKTGTQMAAVATGSMGNFLWRNALCVFPGDNSIALPTRPAPSGISGDFSENPTVTQLYSWVDADKSTFMQPVPVQLQPINGATAVTGNLLEDSTSKISIVVWPGANAVLPQDGEFRVPLQGGSTRIIIDNQSEKGGYVIAPESKHQLTITDWGKPQKTGESPHQEKAVVQADANGQLKIDVTGKSLQIDLSPAA